MINKNLKNKIIEGDTLSVLKTLPDDIFDVGITSPPYNKGEKNKGWLVKNVKYDKISDNLIETNYQNEQIAVLNELFRVMKPGSSFFYNHKVRWDKGEMIHPMSWISKTKWTIRQEIVWDRILAANIRGWRFWQVDERVYWLYKPIDDNKIGVELMSKHALLTSIWRFPPERNSDHPAPFPIKLPARIIYAILNNNKGFIIDPYMGSGTTAVAAKILGNDYFGIDMSSDYISKASERINNYLLEKDVVDEELKLHFVEKTFSERKKDKNYKKNNKLLTLFGD